MSPNASIQSDPTPETQQSQNVVAQRIGQEISRLAGGLKIYQHDLSELLEHAHVSDDLMLRLQALDGVTQVLEDLSRATFVLAATIPQERQGELPEFAEAFLLGDLRERVLGLKAVAELDEPPNNGNVNLF